MTQQATVKYLLEQMKVIRFMLNENEGLLSNSRLLNENDKEAEVFNLFELGDTIPVISKTLFKDCPDGYEQIKSLRDDYVEVRNIAIKLNSQLQKPNKQLLKVEELVNKEIINIKEFEVLFGYGKESQKKFRARLDNPLPYMQQKIGGKVLYNVADVKQWFKNTF